MRNLFLMSLLLFVCLTDAGELRRRNPHSVEKRYSDDCIDCNKKILEDLQTNYDLMSHIKAQQTYENFKLRVSTEANRQARARMVQAGVLCCLGASELCITNMPPLMQLLYSASQLTFSGRLISSSIAMITLGCGCACGVEGCLECFRKIELEQRDIKS